VEGKRKEELGEWRQRSEEDGIEGDVVSAPLAESESVTPSRCREKWKQSSTHSYTRYCDNEWSAPVLTGQKVRSVRDGEANKDEAYAHSRRPDSCEASALDSRNMEIHWLLHH
jgi:hypothetical protein